MPRRATKAGVVKEFQWVGRELMALGLLVPVDSEGAIMVRALGGPAGAARGRGTRRR